MELEVVYDGRIEVLQCYWENEKLIPNGNWFESTPENFETNDEFSENEFQLSSPSDENYGQILPDMQNCEPQEVRIALEKLDDLLFREEELPLTIYDCLPAVIKILQLEEIPPYTENFQQDPGERSVKEICLDIICQVPSKGDPKIFLEEGWLSVVLDSFKFTSYIYATELWQLITPDIMPHLKYEHIKKAVPILLKNISSVQFVESALAYTAYAGIADEFIEDQVVLGKLLKYKVVQNVHEAIKNPVWQNSNVIQDLLYILRTACETTPQYVLKLHKMDVASTICSLLTKLYDISAGKLGLLKGNYGITDNMLYIIKLLIPSHKLKAYKLTKLEELFEGKRKAFTKKIKKENSETKQISEELAKWLKKENERTFRWMETLFKFTQEIFLKTNLLNIKLVCIDCLELLMYGNQAWKSLFKPQEVCEELIQLLSLKEFKSVDPVLDLVSMLLDIAPEYCAQQFFENGLRERIAASIKRNKDKDQLSCGNTKFAEWQMKKKLDKLGSVCNDLLSNGSNDSCLIKLKAAIISLNTQESVAMDSLVVLRQIIQEECIDVYALADTGLIRSLLYFLTGVDTEQRSSLQSIPPSELILSLDDTQKHERDTRIKMFLTVFLGLSADSLRSPIVRPDERKPFIKLLKLLMISFTIPNILENTTDIDNTEVDVIEKFYRQNGTNEPCIYQNGPKHVLDEYLVPYLPQYRSTNDLSSEIAALMSVLYGINKYHRYLYVNDSSSPLVSNGHFLYRQLIWNIEQVNDINDREFTVLPSSMWKMIFACPFLVSFESRLLAIHEPITSVTRNKRLKERITMPHLLPDVSPADVTISRRHIIEESKLYFTSPLVCLNPLTVFFEGETPENGPGVMREYYSLISKELQNSKLNMWKDDTSVSRQNVVEGKVTQCYVQAMHGMYPKPSSGDVDLSNFNLLGKLMARALLDGETFDMNLHEFIYKLFVNDDYDVELADLVSLDPILGRTMEKMQEIASERKKLLSHSNREDKSLAQIQKELSVLKFDGVDIEDLCLDFTLPGYPDVELMEGGNHVRVNLENLQQYVELVVEWFMKKGVWKQIMEIRKGFNCSFPTSILKVFYPEELKKVFCGSFENQTHLLKRWISMCHTCEGYTKESRVVKFLSQIVSEYDTNKQRDFLMFVSGCPRLILHDQDEFANGLIISSYPVRDECDPDDYLPRSSTCNTVLMLPDYSSIDIMRKKLDIVLAEAKIF